VTFRLGLIVSGWFLLVYGGADWLTAQHSLRIPLAMPWERNIPFVPAASTAYMSLYGLFLLAPFLLVERGQLERLAWTLVVLIGIAGVGFVLLPADLEYAPLSYEGPWQGLMRFADQLNLHYNLAPSLHVGLSVACVAVYARSATARQTTLLWCWAAAIAASTLLTHQHHVVDVILGWALAIACVRVCYDRSSAIASTTEHV
jgi:membrane-associated phospholipid phosphatase